MSSWLLRATAAAAVVTGLVSGVQAAELRVALSSEPTAIDPHFHNLSPNNQISLHIFDPLVKQDEQQNLMPGLAVSWEPLDELTWEFRLREGVTWHDGEPFTVADVAFTLERAPDVPNSPSSFGAYINQITDVEIVDDHTIRLSTETPFPLMATNLSTFGIIAAHAAEGATTEDFNAGTAAIGTGPYRFVEFVPGDRIVLEANPDYWDGAEPWERVVFRPISSSASRVAALLSGDVDVIEEVPTADIAQLRENEQLTVASAASNRVIYLHIDSDRDETPHITAKDGSAIENPLKDQRVREALSIAINREAIVERVMEGVAVAAGQLLPNGFQGTSDNLPPPAYDPERAQALLEEAGYADGFRVTLHGPNDRYINDADIAQAVAQMWSRIGLDVSVDTMPRSVYFGRASALEFSTMLVGWGAGTGETSSPLVNLLATFDRDRGRGAANRGRFSNAEMDALLDEALATVDDAARNALLAQASEVAMREVGLIPLHFEVSSWGLRDGLDYVGRADQYTLAMGVRPSE